jgi:beta-glucosidase
MSLAEKISLLHGARDPNELGQAGYWPGLPRLGIPPLRFADGPPGVNVNRDATAMPSPVGLAATFDETAARRYGAVLGREARALQQNVLLTPHVNIVRDPLFRRNHTTFSEDPYLSARLAAAQIVGIQRQGVMAQVKHLAGYNGSENVFIDERTLHEIYLPPFEAAVHAGVASVMCAYNQVNSFWSCENAVLQNEVLRGRWGFRGFVASDWGAVHGPEAVLRGLDLEMPGRELAGRRGPYFAHALQIAVESGVIPMEAVDRAAARILEQMDRFSLLGRRSTAGPRRIDVAADGAIARRIAEESAVLLKNESGALPLTAADLNSVVLIGPTAGQLAAGFMGERAYGIQERLVSPLEAFRRIAPRSKSSIAWSPGVDLSGVPIPVAALSHNALPGLVRQRAESTEAQVDESLDFQGPHSLPPGDFSWTGTLTVAEEGDYTFLVQPASGSGSIAIDGQQVARTGGPGFGVTNRKWSSLIPTSDGRDNGRGVTLRLTAGPHPIAIAANSTSEEPLTIRYRWITPQFRRAGIEAAVSAARKARTAVVFAWNGAGPSLALPEDQNELIERVAAANPRTLVVLNTGGPVAMPWGDRVRAILEIWFPGQEGGWATADVLLGRANPGGKLPVTFPVRLEDSAARAADHPERLGLSAPPGTSGTNPDAPAVTFSEGIAVGYRWYDQQNVEPLFPFGHGLSYTRFEYSNLNVKAAAAGLDVSFTLRNVGPVAGAEVAQIYLGPAKGAPVRMAMKSLAAFRRVELGAGRSRSVTLHVEARALEYWSVDRHDWVWSGDERPVYAGSSSRDIRLEGRTRPAGSGFSKQQLSASRADGRGARW